MLIVLDAGMLEGRTNYEEAEELEEHRHPTPCLETQRKVVIIKQILVMFAVVMGQSVLAADKKPLTKEESAKVIEKTLQ